MWSLWWGFLEGYLSINTIYTDTNFPRYFPSLIGEHNCDQVFLKWNFFSFVGSEINSFTDSRYLPLQFANNKNNSRSYTLGSFLKPVLNVSEKKMEGEMVYNANHWTNHIRKTSLTINGFEPRWIRGLRRLSLRCGNDWMQGEWEKIIDKNDD